MYGECSFCNRQVQLIYASPATRTELIVGPHESIVTQSAKTVSMKCQGAGHKPKGDPTAHD